MGTGDISEEIFATLAEIEDTHDVRILHACESGS